VNCLEQIDRWLGIYKEHKVLKEKLSRLIFIHISKLIYKVLTFWYLILVFWHWQPPR